MALELKRRGISAVRPLEGGYDAWRAVSDRATESPALAAPAPAP